MLCPRGTNKTLDRMSDDLQTVKPYRGRLTPSQIAEGMNAAVENALRLLADAETLFATGRYPTAASLAILALEEAGKISMLRAIAVSATDADLKSAWKDYRSHARKNATWLLPNLATQGARKFDDFRHLFDDNAKHPYVLDQIKQVGFYTDCFKNAHWSLPSKIIDKDAAESMISLAKVFTSKEQHTEEEVALWAEHVGPVWKKDIDWMKQAIINWYAAMQKAGLAPPGPNKVEEFVRSDKPAV